MNVSMATGDDEWPKCDPEYLKALGRAVYNFAVLEITVVWIIERFRRGYFSEYAGAKNKTAGIVAKDFAEVARQVKMGAAEAELAKNFPDAQQAKRHAAEAELTAISKTFSDLKERRNKLLHANPAIFVVDGQVSNGLHYPAHDIWWNIHTVGQAAADFAAAAEEANRVLAILVIYSPEPGEK
jgi:hypothetical protein